MTSLAIGQDAAPILASFRHLVREHPQRLRAALETVLTEARVLLNTSAELQGRARLGDVNAREHLKSFNVVPDLDTPAGDWTVLATLADAEGRPGTRPLLTFIDEGDLGIVKGIEVVVGDEAAETLRDRLERITADLVDSGALRWRRTPSLHEFDLEVAALRNQVREILNLLPRSMEESIVADAKLRWSERDHEVHDFDIVAIAAAFAEQRTIESSDPLELGEHWLGQRKLDIAAVVMVQRDGTDATRFESLREIKKFVEQLRLRLETSHSPDFTSVVWFGTPYTFAKGNQAESVRVLWEAMELGGHSVSQETIQARIDSSAETFRLAHVFRAHTAWGSMIQPAEKGCYRLVPPTFSS